ncbi:MAG: methyltransferase domain-containing protein, partial [Candidatus Kryptoniota bacterium]
ANWSKILQEFRGSSRRWYLSPALYAQYKIGLPLMSQYIHGKMIDLGCGDMPFREFLINQVDMYDSLDLWPQSNDVIFVGNIEDMNMIESCTYDSAICLEVLEHVPNPQQAIKEIHRILKPSGIVIISVPHLSRLHNIPHDYFRFTIYGITYLLQSAGFEIIDIKVKGGLLCFLGHQLSITILSKFWEVTLFRGILLALIKYCVTIPCYRIDRLFDSNRLFALGYIAVAQKFGD